LKLLLVLQMLMLQAATASPLSCQKLTGWKFVTTLLTALSECFLQSTVQRIRASPLYGLIIDLPTDRAGGK
jgi:hypothetical protein